MSVTPPIVAHPATEPQIGRGAIITLALLFAALIAMRLPGAWTHGRFVDEELTVFFAYAWTFDPWHALFRPFAGYWNLAANGSTLWLAWAVEADLIDLEHAPYATMLTGLLFQLVPVALLLTGSANWLPNRLARIAASLLVVLVPGTEDVWLNVMHIQFYLALSIAIILALTPPTGKRQRLFYSVILVLGPLCGPGAIVLLPLFVLRAVSDRDGQRSLQALALAAASAVQLVFFYGESPVRGMHIGPVTLCAGLFIRLIVMPFSGPQPTGYLGEAAQFSFADGGMLVPLLAVLAVLLFGLLGWWTLQRKDDSRWLLVAALLVAGVSLGLGTATRPDAVVYSVLSGIAAGRYNYLPGALLSLSFVSLAVREGQPRRLQRLAAALTFQLLAVGAFWYPLPSQAFASGPPWPEEVAAWRTDRDHGVRSWPDGAPANLSGRRISCPDRALPPGDSAHPRYCESGWMSAFYPQAPKQQ